MPWHQIFVKVFTSIQLNSVGHALCFLYNAVGFPARLTWTEAVVWLESRVAARKLTSG